MWLNKSVTILNATLQLLDIYRLVMKCNLRITGIYTNYALVACRQCFEICTREFGIETWNY